MDSHRGYLGEAVELLLRTDQVSEPEHEITLDICIATGANSQNGCSDYSEILVFLRKLVSNENVASVEQVLQNLNNSKRMGGRRETATEPWTASAYLGGDTTMASHERMTFSAKIGGGVSKLGAEELTGRDILRPPTLLLQVSPSLNQGKRVLYAPPDIQELVNMECGGEHNFRSTLLYCAIFTGNEEMVRCLLKWGADATLALECVGDRGQLHHVWNHTPICVAALLKHAGVVRCLLTHGASPYHGASRKRSGCFGETFDSTRLSTYAGCRDDATTCEALCMNPKYPPPIMEICRVQQEGNDEGAMRMTPYCRWDAACCNSSIASLLQKVSIPIRRSLLDMPCFTDAERICKQFCCSLIMRSFCSNSECVKDFEGKEVMNPTKLTAIVGHLLQEGAEPAGLSVSNADALCKAWLRVENAEAEMRGTHPVKFESRRDVRFLKGGCVIRHRPKPPVKVLALCVNEATRQRVGELLPPGARYLKARSAAGYFSYGTPPVVDRLLLTRSVKDPMVKLLVEHGGLPGISTVDEIPFVDGKLHDGPSCQCDVELSAAQRKVSLFHVLTPHPKPKALTHLCRSAIIEACHGYGVVKAIQSLDLPPVLMDYLLFR
eukprot:scpid52108/ scgid25079/ 